MIITAMITGGMIITRMSLGPMPARRMTTLRNTRRPPPTGTAPAAITTMPATTMLVIGMPATPSPTDRRPVP